MRGRGVGLRQVDDGECGHGTAAARPRHQRGRIRFGSRDLAALPEPEFRRLRGAEIAMIFQEPMTALNPLKTIGDQIGEMFRIHTPLSAARSTGRVLEFWVEVGIPDPRRASRPTHTSSRAVNASAP
jgi:ABC-type microcin C transport system duplicated ATPase subunit YejF